MSNSRIQSKSSSSVTKENALWESKEGITIMSCKTENFVRR